MKIQNTGPGAITFDDSVLGKRRTIPTGEVTWVAASAIVSLPPGGYTIIDAEDGYGKRTRRTLVTASDVSDLPAFYQSGSLNQAKYIDEFNAVGDTEPLSGKFFKRTWFVYEDTGNPTKWTAITETEHVEP